MKKSFSLHTLLSASFAALIIVLTIVLSVAIGHRSNEEVRSEIGNSLKETSYIMAGKLDHYMWSRYGEVSMLSTLSEMRQTEELEGQRQVLNRLKEKFPSFSWIGMTNDEGTVLSSTDGILEGADISERPVFKEAQDKTFIGDVHEAVLLANLLPNPTGEVMKFVDISTPVFNEENQFIGVLAAHLSWEWAKEIEDSMMKPLQKRKSLEMFVVSGIDNTVLLGPQEELGSVLQLTSVDKARKGENGWVLEKWPDGKEYLTGYVLASGYKDYPGLDWVVLVRQPIDDAYAPIKETLQYIYTFGLILAGLLGILGWIVAGKITSPLKNITTAADQLRRGERVTIPAHKGIKEIEVLSYSLKKLISKLTKTETALEKMEDVARRDHLTGLPNRIALYAFIEEVIEDNLAFAVLYMDLDGFKKINDQLGHEAGDILLKAVSDRLNEAVPAGGMVARMGGDEFVMVLPVVANPEKEGMKIGERIIASINNPFLVTGKGVSVGCSIGGAVCEPDINASIKVNEIIRSADEALYRVKRTGKNSIAF
ncbi:diguanylate cyclase [Sutcliffiella horikoshii]|uniref:sensor domain-containing diguanylate cyclase n=1 Tax=Sutcliffiella horikoshii TaxID=79883 RepID=UPI001CBBCBF5|nr:diguanylate cyclase [Sutcliffiella horikoshii]UAL48201.1 diguanylate cyclase [Sutcliffiella horikoshii]